MLSAMNIKRISFVLIFSLLMMKCSQRESVSAPTFLTLANSADLSLYGLNPITYEEVEIELTAADKRFALELTKPITSFIKLAERNVPIYLEPGYDLIIDDLDTTPSFKGVGADANTFMHSSNAIMYQSNLSDASLPITQFLYLVDSVELQLSLLRSAYDYSPAIERIQRLNAASIVGRKLNYLLVNYDLYDQETIIPKELKEAVLDAPKYADLLDLGDMNVMTLLYQFNMAFIEPATWKDVYTSNDTLRYKYPLEVQQYLHTSELDSNVKEYLTSLNLYNQLRSRGFDPITDKLYQNFASNYPESNYLTSIKTQYDKVKVLAGGNPAPEIDLITSKGTEKQLSDLRGQLVYLDIWATWCKPCIEEFEYSANLIEDFEHDAITFAFLSIDDEVSKWEQFLEKNTTPNGLHFAEKEPGATRAAFQFSGIPRYILIDNDGKIIDANAPRPSSFKLKPLLELHLADSEAF